MALTIKIRADASHFKKTIAGIEVQASGLTGVIGKLATSQAAFGVALAAAAAGAVALGAGLAFIKDASTKAAGIESLTMQFETLLGSAGKAKERMEEIKKFAASTPFEVANLSETSKLLQTLGGDLLATGAGLRMVGDAAAIAGQPIQEVGLHFGRLFNAITSGTSAGESIGRLQELGLMTGKVKLEFEALAAAQKKGEKPILTQTQAMTLLQGVFAKTAGAMERLSMTTEGKLSNMKDAVDNLKVSFGTGFNQGLKTALDATNSFLPQLESRFAAAGDFLGKALTESISGDTEKFAALGVLVGTAFWSGLKEVGGNVIVESIRGWIEKTGAMAGGGTGVAASVAGNALLGQKPTMQDMIGNVRTGLQPALEGMERANAPDWNKQLEEQRRRVDQEILNEAKKTNQLLQKSATVGLYPTSR